MVLSKTSVMAWACEDWLSHLPHSPHGGENGREERLVSRPRVLRREAVVSLDTRRTPAILLCCGDLWEPKERLVRRVVGSSNLA